MTRSPGPEPATAGSAQLLAAVLAVGVSVGTAPTAGAAQDLAREVRTAGPAVRFAYPARANVCGTADGILIREPDGSTMFMTARRTMWDMDGWHEGEPPCETGDVVVELELRDDRVDHVDLGVGVDPVGRPGRDLGRVSGPAAAEFLLAETPRADPDAGRRLIIAAWLAADAVVWPRLLELARDRGLPRGTRKAAIHWLGRTAAAEAVQALGGIVRDRTEADRIREAAVFGLSQLRDDRRVPLLIEVVRTVDEPRVRSQALFWLADSEDPRALALFEEILTGSH